jgi:hypothetical protein
LEPSCFSFEPRFGDSAASARLQIWNIAAQLIDFASRVRNEVAGIFSTEPLVIKPPSKQQEAEAFVAYSPVFERFTDGLDFLLKRM